MFTLHDPLPIDEKAPVWASAAREFSELFGHSPFADLFLRDPATGRIAILVTEQVGLITLEPWSIEEFSSRFLNVPANQDNLFRRPDYDFLAARLGVPSADECFYAVPYASIGGSGELETYQKGDLWAHLYLYGQTLL
ncbi:MAG: T6SS immunity protein Tdi1 domain-containing protein [Betaproteobacteria bacterium]